MPWSRLPWWTTSMPAGLWRPQAGRQRPGRGPGQARPSQSPLSPPIGHLSGALSPALVALSIRPAGRCVGSTAMGSIQARSTDTEGAHRVFIGRTIDNRYVYAYHAYV